MMRNPRRPSELPHGLILRVPSVSSATYRGLHISVLVCLFFQYFVPGAIVLALVTENSSVCVHSLTTYILGFAIMVRII